MSGKVVILGGIVAAALVAGFAGVEWLDARDRAAAEAHRQETDRNARNSAQRAKCDRAVTEWDANRRQRLRAEYGDLAETVVKNCRYLLTIPD